MLEWNEKCSMWSFHGNRRFTRLGHVCYRSWQRFKRQYLKIDITCITLRYWHTSPFKFSSKVHLPKISANLISRRNNFCQYLCKHHTKLGTVRKQNFEIIQGNYEPMEWGTDGTSPNKFVKFNVTFENEKCCPIIRNIDEHGPMFRVTKNATSDQVTRRKRTDRNVIRGQTFWPGEAAAPQPERISQSSRQ